MFFQYKLIYLFTYFKSDLEKKNANSLMVSKFQCFEIYGNLEVVRFRF